MIQYKYVAKNISQEKFTGTFIAEDMDDLVAQLQKQGLYLVSAKPYTGQTPNSFFTLGTGGVSLAELNTFCRQFAIMINSGISILQSLDILKEQEYSSYFKQLLVIIDDDVRAGMMFSEALNKHKTVFPSFFRSMISVGERSGKMDIVLNSLADYYENDTATRRKIKSAFSYPIMLAIMMVGIIAAMLIFVVPTFRESLSSLEVEATGITAFVYNLSDFLVAYGLYILAGVVVIILIFFAYGKTTSGRAALDKLKLQLPGFGKVFIATITARFARSFGLLLTSGMDVSEAMEVVPIVFDNVDVEKRFKLATEDVKHGVAIATAFEKYKLFPNILNQMVAVGERTNSLDDVLARSCSFFDEQVTTTINSLVSLIQPIMLGLMGGIVGFLFIAIYSPMLDIMNNLDTN